MEMTIAIQRIQALREKAESDRAAFCDEPDGEGLDDCGAWMDWDAEVHGSALEACVDTYDRILRVLKEESQ